MAWLQLLHVGATNITVMVLAAIVSVGSMYVVIKIGHSGAKSMWNSVKTGG